MPDEATPVFRSLTAATDLAATAPGGQLVHTVVRTRLAAARPDYDIGRYGAHSLRAGFVTEPFRRGHDPITIMRQTGHTTVESLLRYARLHNVHTGNAATNIGL